MAHRLMLVRTVLGVALGALLSSCTARTQPSKAETALANMAKDVIIPIETQTRQNPLPDTEQVIDEGRQVFIQSCALCHGTDGHGETYIGRNMNPPAMDMTSPHVQHWSDAELFWIIRNGVRLTGMPGWESAVSEKETWELARFIHNLPRLDATSASTTADAIVQLAAQPTPEGLIKYGKTLYRQEGCFMCHRLNGEGGKVGPDLTTEGNRGRTPEWLTGHFKNPSSYVPGSVMPPFKNLTEEQLQALTAFLQDQKGRKP